jgi:hypothetical protein
MAEKKYRVTLTDEEKEQLKAIIDRGKHTGKKRKLIPGIIACRPGIHR